MLKRLFLRELIMASNHWKCDSCASSNSMAQHRCRSCGDRRGSRPMSGGKWKCYNCTYSNESHRTKCSACASPSPNARPGRRSGRSNGYKSDSDDGYDFDFEDDERNSSRKHGRSGRHKGRRRSYDDSDDDLSDEVRIVLLGKTGSGKSATGNTILNGDYFESKISGTSVTSRCLRKSASRFGKRIHLVDTPGIFDTSMENREVQREILKCIGMTSPGPHAFLLVLSLSRFTQEEEDSVNHFISYFGDEVYDYMIVLFTRKDDLEYEGVTLDDHVRKVPKPLKDIIRRCGGRKIAFNNRATGSKRDQQVQALLDMVEDIVQQNRGKCYTNDMYNEAETVMLKKEAEIRRARKEKKRQERREIEREIEEKYKKELARHKRDEEDISVRVAELESKRDYHDTKANKLNDEIDKLRNRIANDKKHGKVDAHLERKLRDLEDELDKVKSKNKGSDVHRELKKMREELDRTKKRAKKMQKEKDHQMEMRLQEQERRFQEMQKPREVVRQEVEKGNGLESLVEGIVSVGKMVWKGISMLF